MIRWIKSLWARFFSKPKPIIKPPEMIEPEPAIDEPTAPSDPAHISVDSQIVRQAFLEELFKHEGEKETHGKNRSPSIDKWNGSVGAPLGSPYCTSGPMYCMDRVEERLGIRFKRNRTASTQSYGQWMTKNIPGSIIGPNEIMAGDVLIFQSRNDASHGHWATATGKNKNGLVPTFEFNTDGRGLRDGDGVWFRTRSIDGDSNLKLRYVIRFWEHYE